MAETGVAISVVLAVPGTDVANNVSVSGELLLSITVVAVSGSVTSSTASVAAVPISKIGS